jgi:hypothetical protein
MALAALNASIRPYADQQGRDLERPEGPGCERGNYVIRLDPRSFTPSPTYQVVVLFFGEGASDFREFDITTDTSNWPARPPGTVGLSPCYSAYGVVHRTAAGWQAEMRQVPKSPDAL